MFCPKCDSDKTTVVSTTLSGPPDKNEISNIITLVKVYNLLCSSCGHQFKYFETLGKEEKPNAIVP